MTREEAIKVASEIYGWLKTDREREALETLVPELAESEDERIRKALLEKFTEEKKQGAKYEIHGCSLDSIISFLEKQKEQKPAEWSEEDKRALNDAIVAISMYANGQIPYILPSILLEDVERLKSLRPSWKPTEEQINLLGKVYSFIWANPATPAEYQDGLGDFIEQLKTL